MTVWCCKGGTHRSFYAKLRVSRFFGFLCVQHDAIVLLRITSVVASSYTCLSELLQSPSLCAFTTLIRIASQKFLPAGWIRPTTICKDRSLQCVGWEKLDPWLPCCFDHELSSVRMCVHARLPRLSAHTTKERRGRTQRGLSSGLSRSTIITPCGRSSAPTKRRHSTVAYSPPCQRAAPPTRHDD